MSQDTTPSAPSPPKQRFTFKPRRPPRPTAARSVAPPVPIPPSYAHEALISGDSKAVHVVLTTDLTEARRSGARWLLTGCGDHAPIQLVTWLPFERADPPTPRCERCVGRLAKRRSMGAVIVAPLPPDEKPVRDRRSLKEAPTTLRGKMERLLAVLDRAERYGFSAQDPVDVFTLITEQARSVITLYGKRYVVTMEEEMSGRERGRRRRGEA
jgi:hypothetical protein